MSGINNNNEYIYYQLCDSQNNLGNVDRIRLTRSEFENNNVGDLRDAIMKQEQLQCRPRDLRLYESGTTVEDYESKERLNISLGLSNSKIQGTAEDDPLLVVVPASPLPASAANHLTTVQEGDNVLILLVSCIHRRPFPLLT